MTPDLAGLLERAIEFVRLRAHEREEMDLLMDLRAARAALAAAKPEGGGE